MIAAPANVITVEQRLYPQQFAFLHDHRRYPALIGGRNSGKTFAGAYKAFERASRGGLGLIAGPSFPAMKLGPKPRFLAVLDGAGLTYRENRNDNTLYIPSLNAGIQFAGLENDTYTRGPNYAWGWVDELDFVANPEMYKTAKASVRDGTDYQLFSTSTPKGQSIIWREWVLDADDFHRLYTASTFDNFFVDADSFVAGLGYSGAFYAQEINAEFVKLEGLVYPEFNRQRQVRAVDCADWPAALGLDIGARSPTALMTLRYSGDRFHIERELYQREMGNPDIVDAVIAEYERTNALFVVVDPEAANLVLDLQRKGLHVRKAQKAVKEGITRVTGIIPDLTVDPACIETLAELDSYQYPPGNEKDQPIKANDHCLIAGTLVETEHGPTPIEAIKAGDFVWTRDGLRPVVAAGLTNPSAQVSTVLTDDGRKLTGTSQHPVWTENRGWVLFDTLRYGDILSVWNQRSSSSTASSSAAILNQQLGLSACTSRRVLPIVSGALVAYTKRFGKRSTALFPRVITSITSTIIRSTTHPRIWPAGLLSSIGPITAPSLQVHARSPILMRFAHSLSHGIVPMKAEPGIVNTASRDGRSVRRLTGHAINAVRHSPRSRIARMTASAPTTASRRGVEHLGSTTNHASARPVAQPSLSTATPRPRVAPVFVLGRFVEPKPQAVYNLTVSETPEFFANGILVHNCMDDLRYLAMELTRPRRKVRVY